MLREGDHTKGYFTGWEIVSPGTDSPHSMDAVGPVTLRFTDSSSMRPLSMAFMESHCTMQIARLHMGLGRVRVKPWRRRP